MKRSRTILDTIVEEKKREVDQFVNGWLRAGCPLKRMQGVRDEEE